MLRLVVGEKDGFKQEFSQVDGSAIHLPREQRMRSQWRGERVQFWTY